MQNENPSVAEGKKVTCYSCGIVFEATSQYDELCDWCLLQDDYTITKEEPTDTAHIVNHVLSNCGFRRGVKLHDE